MYYVLLQKVPVWGIPGLLKPVWTTDVERARAEMITSPQGSTLLQEVPPRPSRIIDPQREYHAGK